MSTSRVGMILGAAVAAGAMALGGGDVINITRAGLLPEPRARQAPKRRRPQNKRSYADTDNGAKAVAKRLARLGK